MWRLWSRGLEILGRLRLRLPFRWRKTLRVGDPAAVDARDGYGWRDYLDAERLYDVWGPLPDGVWMPFHCVPLFAALDSLRREEIGPTRPVVRPDPGSPEPVEPDLSPSIAPAAAPDAENLGGVNLGGSIAVAPSAPAERRELPSSARPGAPAPAWLQPDMWTILDLPGPMAVEAAAWLVSAGGCQPVCTFDNWPHARGVLRAEATLAELLRWATTIAIARRAFEAGSPPLWICDSERLGAMAPRPRDFDNRYYLDDSILPGPALLRSAGIRHVVYVTLGGEESPLPDLDACFKDLLAAGFSVRQISVMHPDGEPSPIRLPAEPRKPPSDFKRSGAGGFGQDVPDPSSGGSGG